MTKGNDHRLHFPRNFFLYSMLILTPCFSFLLTSHLNLIKLFSGGAAAAVEEEVVEEEPEEEAEAPSGGGGLFGGDDDAGGDY
jgi:hypothetical protein